MKQEEINELNRIFGEIEERKKYQQHVSDLRDKLRQEVTAGSRVYMYALVRHTEAREWGKHYYDIMGFFFSFGDALTALKNFREDNIEYSSTPISVSEIAESAEWEYSDYDGCYTIGVQFAPLEIPF